MLFPSFKILSDRKKIFFLFLTTQMKRIKLYENKISEIKPLTKNTDEIYKKYNILFWDVLFLLFYMYLVIIHFSLFLMLKNNRVAVIDLELIFCMFFSIVIILHTRDSYVFCQSGAISIIIMYSCISHIASLTNEISSDTIYLHYFILNFYYSVDSVSSYLLYHEKSKNSDYVLNKGMGGNICTIMASILLLSRTDNISHSLMIMVLCLFIMISLPYFLLNILELSLKNLIITFFVITCIFSYIIDKLLYRATIIITVVLVIFSYFFVKFFTEYEIKKYTCKNK
ncbi:hypothetical protein SLOPH_878 [Spraguea lophii 42_110]|uniref:Phosphatidylinositol N-acetylglucosaminyltransferase n=1 Tax=Spraguea lophii (strain 42_110) TaxID=1358809 RepID=S7XTC0_SPRLO|nr:hypothetical protein SLOPH_878 [Spraguea lophii 42_110]